MPDRRRSPSRIFSCVFTALLAVHVPCEGNDPQAPGQAGNDVSPEIVESAPAAAASNRPYRMWRDDANLHAVEFVGDRLGWAVGDHGAVWHTDDGAESWQLLPSPVECPLRSACFLTDKIGWIAGGGTLPYAGIQYGVLLFTNDGGRSWQQLAKDRLPRLHHVQFFGLEEGVAVGDSTAEYPTGVLVTRDGGKTWTGLPGQLAEGWRTACFSRPETGVIAGQRGGLSLVGGDRLLRSQLQLSGVRGIHDVAVEQDDTGWFVGDGGLVMRTDSGGIVWHPPPAPLPQELREALDFRAVTMRGSKVWLAGQPGSVVWHSPDAGASWIRQPTGQAIPIHALTFVSERLGIAVGALGMILRTDDGGFTWNAVRAGGRRTALMSLCARPGEVSLIRSASEAGEHGYRDVVLLPARRDVGAVADGRDLDLRVAEAVLASGGTASQIDWRLPIAVPDVDQDESKLIAELNRQTEGKFAQVLLSSLVRHIRTWRPSIVVLDAPAENDALGRLLNEAVLRAVEQAADPTRELAQQELCHLKPWQVERVFLRLPAGSSGQSFVDPDDYLPRLGQSARMATASALSMLAGQVSHRDGREAYRLVWTATPSENGLLHAGGLFAGVAIPTGSDARREPLPLDEAHMERELKLARRQRNFHEYTRRSLDDPRHAGQLIGQLNGLLEGLRDEQAAEELARLGREYAQRSEWDLAEQAYVELLEAYPQQPAAAEGMRWLMQLWTGSEVVWQRLRVKGASGSRLTADANAAVSRVRTAEQLVQSSEGTLGERRVSGEGNGIVTASGEQKLRMAQSADWRTAIQMMLVPTFQPVDRKGRPGEVRSATLSDWQTRAEALAKRIEKQSPLLFRSPEVQFPLAALRRQKGDHAAADRVYRFYEGTGVDDPWRRTAVSELWLLNPVSTPPKPLAWCRQAVERPQLDGLLSDSCWQRAAEIPLKSDEEAAAARRPAGASGGGTDLLRPFVLLSYDREFIYLAASLPRVAGVPDDRPQLPGRTRDAALEGFDRISLYLDVDRDYATYYEFHVDQRGCTAEACWKDSRWDPKWYVAAEGDATHWRIEAAIPLSELAPLPPERKAVWGVGLVRTIPGAGVQSWTQPAAVRPRAETFGLLRFD